MKRLALILALSAAAPAMAQHADHSMHQSAPATPAPADPHAGHDMSTMAQPEAPDHAAMGHDMGAMQHGAGGTALPAGDAPAPPVPTDWAADAFFDSADMARTRDDVWREHGGGTFSQVMIDQAEVQVRNGRENFLWNGEGWFGGDINRLVIESEGEGRFGEGVESAEIQALYSRAIGPYFNLQAGARHDFEPGPQRTYATIGFEGLAPYWFEVEAGLFLSDKGELSARLEGYYDQRITQRLILQPRIELDFAAEDVPERGIGSGLSTAELSLRLRYEIVREFAPYVGVFHERAFGQTARYARADGEGARATRFVIGVRSWF